MESPLEQAGRLAALWDRLATQHVALGCSCLMGGVSVTLEDFERDIADWLVAESERLGPAGVGLFLGANGPLSVQDHAIRTTLHRLRAGEAAPEVAEWLLERLTRTLESYARLHGPVPDAPLRGGSGAWRTGYRN